MRWGTAKPCAVPARKDAEDAVKRWPVDIGVSSRLMNLKDLGGICSGPLRKLSCGTCQYHPLDLPTDGSLGAGLSYDPGLELLRILQSGLSQLLWTSVSQRFEVNPSPAGRNGPLTESTWLYYK